jgi:acyl carrier protein
MQDYSEITEKLFVYVRENTFKNTGNMDSGTRLFIEGILDSMGFVMLLDFIEEHFGVSVGDQDLVEENFESIDAIARLVLRKLEESTVS